MFRLPLIALFTLLPLASLKAAEPTVATRNDVTYAVAGTQKLQLDLAMPKTGGPYPLVVCLHGGAWKTGSRKDLSRPGTDFGTRGRSLIEILAARGFVAASVSYRLAPENKFPAQIEDAKTAIRFLRANAKQFHIDPNRVAALGFSAGGHIAALLGTTDTKAGFDGPLYPDQSSRVNCVVDFFGPTDLTLYCQTPGLEQMFFVPLLGTTSKKHPEVYKKASPIDYVSKDDPPFLLIHGTLDLVVPVLHSELLCRKLTEAGVNAKLLPVSGEGHGWNGEAARHTIDAAVKFLSEQLKVKK
jgi:acetyl esterase/lipase